MGELTLQGLRVVAEVAARGSFTAAAASLGYTQSAISRQVAASEVAAGAPLFERRARGVVPTAAGAALVRHASVVLAEVDAARQELAGLRDRLAGTLAVGTFPAAGAVLVPRAMARLRAEHPGLRVSLVEASSPAQLDRLRRGRIEVAVLGVGPDLPAYDLAGLAVEPVAGGRAGVAVWRDHRFGDRVDVAELRQETWVLGRGEAVADPQFGAWPTLPEPRVGATVRDWPTRLGLVAAGLGVTVVPRLMVDAMPAGVRVVEVDDPGYLGREAVAVTAEEPSRAAVAMVAALRDVGAQGVPPGGSGSTVR